MSPDEAGGAVDDEFGETPKALADRHPRQAGRPKTGFSTAIYAIELSKGTMPPGALRYETASSERKNEPAQSG